MTYPRSEITGTLAGVTYRSEAVASDGTVILFQKGRQRPTDPRFSYNDKWDGWEAAVRVEECDRLVEIGSFARYKGIACQVIAIGESGRAELYYVGHDAGEPERLGFKQFDKHEYSKSVPVGELYDYHEIHRDLLFEHWRETTFGEAKA